MDQVVILVVYKSLFKSISIYLYYFESTLLNFNEWWIVSSSSIALASLYYFPRLGINVQTTPIVCAIFNIMQTITYIKEPIIDL